LVTYQKRVCVRRGNYLVIVRREAHILCDRIREWDSQTRFYEGMIIRMTTILLHTSMQVVDVLCYWMDEMIKW